jgi:predicted nucleic acid-binding protein
VAFDTNALIYLIERNPDYLAVLQPVFEKVERRQIQAHTSAICLIEVLVKPLREGRHDLAGRYRDLILSSRNFTVHDVSVPVSERAAAIRARWNLRVPDAIVAATALLTGCSHVVTNDRDMKPVEGFTAVVIKDYL